MRHSYRFVLIVLIIAMCFDLRASARTEDAKRCASQALPSNLDLPRDLVPIVRKIYSQSSTFRSQCARVARADNLSVFVQLDTSIRSSCRAFTIFQRRSRTIRALVHIPPPGAVFAELMGHEFEHILEQLEGLNLRDLARVPRSGVREVERDLFETDRAQRTGRVVADEMRSARAPRPSAD
jgi:hypothetical protein